MSHPPYKVRLVPRSQTHSWYMNEKFWTSHLKTKNTCRSITIYMYCSTILSLFVYHWNLTRTWKIFVSSFFFQNLSFEIGGSLLCWSKIKRDLDGCAREKENALSKRMPLFLTFLARLFSRARPLKTCALLHSAHATQAKLGVHLIYGCSLYMFTAIMQIWNEITSLTEVSCKIHSMSGWCPFTVCQTLMGPVDSKSLITSGELL